MPKPSATPAWQVSLAVMATTVVGSALVACLYWAQAICVPVALATFLAFLLSPLVTTLHRRGLGRTPSVLLVVLAAILFLAGVAGVVGAQVEPDERGA